MHTLTIVPGEMTLAELRKVYEKPVKVQLKEEAFENMKTTLEHVRNIVDNNITTYGINTGIGILATTNVGIKDLQELQQSIVLSHAVGVGPAANDGLVRLMMVLKVNSIGRGYSGIRTEIVKALITLINKEIYPVIPIKGSVGASGDLAPLSHMASVLLGEGKATHKGEVLEAKDALKKAGIEPLMLGPREGVALINGTQTSTAFALKGLFETEDLFANAVVCGALTVEAAMASRKPFDERINKIKGHKGQVDTAEIYRYLLNDKSEVSEAHNSCTRVQDPYSLRCQPQVMGACLTQIRNAAEMLLTEANSSSDNPVIFSSEEIISAGNFHAEFVAMACDNLALAIAEIGSISERRISLLMDKNLSGLPWFLVNNSGVNTGFMTAHVTAAALVSENKLLSHPAVVDSIPTSANQEDHVSMAPIAGKRLWEMAENVRNILAIEWLCAVQGLDFRQMKTTTKLEEAKKILRDHVTFLDKDRFMASDINIVKELIEENALVNLLPKQLMPSWGGK